MAAVVLVLQQERCIFRRIIAVGFLCVDKNATTCFSEDPPWVCSHDGGARIFLAYAFVDCFVWSTLQNYLRRSNRCKSFDTINDDKYAKATDKLSSY